MGIKDWFKRDKEEEPREEDYVSLDLPQEQQTASSPVSKLKVKFYKCAEPQDGGAVLDLIKKKDTILLVNIAKMRNDMNQLKEWTARIKDTCKDAQGDIIGLSKDLLLITPASVEIERSSIVEQKV